MAFLLTLGACRFTRYDVASSASLSPYVAPYEKPLLVKKPAQSLSKTDIPSDKKSLIPELTLLCVAIVWGVHLPVIKVGLQYIPPLPYNVARMLIGSLVALLALWLSGTYRPVNRSDLWKMIRAGALGFFLFQLFFTEGVLRTTAGNASFMLCLMPLSVLLLNKFYGLETIRPTTLIGLACSLLGIALIVIGSGQQLSLSSNHLLGTLFILFSQAGYAYYTVFSKELLARYSTYQVTAYLMVIATGLLFFASTPVIMEVNWLQIPLVAWACIFFSGIIALCLGNFLWIWGVGRIGSGRGAIFNNVSPVFAVIAGYYLLGETFGLLQGIGAVCVFVGVYITRKSRSLKTE